MSELTNSEVQTLAVFSLQTVREKEISLPRELIDTPNIARQVMQNYLENKDREHLAVIMVDGQNRMLGISTIAIGGMAGLASSTRDVLKIAVLLGAYGIILGHNHPSSSLEPSPQDMNFTRAVQKGCDALDIIMMDHIIVSSGTIPGIMSFHEKGLLHASSTEEVQ